MKRALVVLVLLSIALPSIGAPMTTVTEGAEALAEYACEGEGGAAEFEWEPSGGGSYEVSVVCESGMSIGDGLSFNCPMCEPV